tara:strand:- start:280 stop:453 length:174 start_codon:yes stop_codon:yes gene_type:complete
MSTIMGYFQENGVCYQITTTKTPEAMLTMTAEWVVEDNLEYTNISCNDVPEGTPNIE